MHRTTAAVFLVSLTVAACTPIAISPNANTTGTPVTATGDAMMKKPDTEVMVNAPAGDAMMEQKKTDEMKKPEGAEAMAKPTTPSSYVPFSQAAYDEAKAAGRPIALYFYATWCPICARQEPITVDTFTDPEVSTWSIAAFRVNFNDPETDADEQALAKEFGISYQHTLVLLHRDGTAEPKISGYQTKAQLVSALEKIK